MSDFIYQSLSLSPSSQSVPTSFSHSVPPYTLILFTVILYNIIVSPIYCIQYTALLKTLHIHLW